MGVITRTKGIWIASLLWLICIAAALFAAVLRQSDVVSLLPFAGIAAVPAVISLALSPYLRREWAQIVVIFLWIALAILACLSFKFFPMALLFLCAPAIAALFEREKVVEAMVLAAIAAAGIYYFKTQGNGAEFLLADSAQTGWSVTTGIAATIGLLIGALFGVASRSPQIDENVSNDLLAAVPGGLMRVDGHNRVRMATPVAAAQLNIGDDMNGLSANDIFTDPDQQSELEHIIETSRGSGKKVSRRFRLRQPGGGYRMAEITAGPLDNGDILLHVYDSTAHEARIKSLHDAYASAQKDASGKTLFFAGVSHELRTPLNAIIGFSDMMRSRLFGPLPNKYAEYADLIHDSGQHMLDLIGDVLDLSKVEVGKYDLTYHKFDAADVIRSSAKMLRPSADSAELRLDVEVLSDNGELLIEADRKALRQMILNLLSNAIKFTPKGGRILVRGDIEGHDLRIGVVDNGAGMSAAELEKIGRPFEQTETGKSSDIRGSGLGLSLVKSLAELHNGKLELSSQRSIGTTAEVILPQRRPAQF